ncbi:hypothetical protein D3C71_78750 [compost metagenome]
MTAVKYPVLAWMNIERREKFLSLSKMTMHVRQDDIADHLKQVVSELRTIAADPDTVRVVSTRKIHYVMVGDKAVLHYSRNWLRRWVYHTDVYGKNIHFEMVPDLEAEEDRRKAAYALFDMIFGISEAILSTAVKAQTQEKNHQIATLQETRH